jgi:DNA/RNA-binding domain of Phe-tRNA-synthetase-like protein
MSIEVTIVEVASAFPHYRVAVVVAESLTISQERPPMLDDLIRQHEKAARERWADTELSQIPGIAAWRRAYRAFGIKQTRYRSSVERLLKNVLAGRPLARINNFVDAYNAVSLAHVLPLGADDLDCITSPLAFRYARAGDSFADMADAAGTRLEDVETEAPRPGEVVLADATKLLCRRWNWRQDARSLITPVTRHAVVPLQANGFGDVAAATVDLVELVEKFCAGRCRSMVLDAQRPTGTV